MFAFILAPAGPGDRKRDLRSALDADSLGMNFQPYADGVGLLSIRYAT
jgi:hypothetical protein